MRCPECGRALEAEHLVCPDCAEPIPPATQQIPKVAAKFKPNLGDQAMQVITVLVCLAYHSFGTIIGMFYFLVVLGYLMDGVVWCVRRIGGVGKKA